MSRVQRSTARSAVTNESFAVRQRVAPGPHGDRPGSHASAPADGRIRTVDAARRSWRRRPRRSPAGSASPLVHTAVDRRRPWSTRRSSGVTKRSRVSPAVDRIRTVDARRRRQCRSSPRRQATRRSWSTRGSTDVVPGPHGDRPGDHASTPAKGGIRAVDGSAERSPLLAKSSSRQTL